MVLRQLQSDVNSIEETELRRLEGWESMSAGNVATAGTLGPLVPICGGHIQCARLVEVGAAQPSATARAMPVVHATYAVPVQGLPTVTVQAEVAWSAISPIAAEDAATAQFPGAFATPVAGGEATRTVGGPMRSVRKQRRAELLQTRWRCGYCTKYTERSKDVCGNCSAPRANPVGGDRGAELLRFESRKNSSKGRQHNQVATGDASAVKRRAAGVFDASRKAQATREETEELEKAIGGVHYLEDQESNMSVIDGFLIVHYKGQHSIVQGTGKAAGLTEEVVADFFNTIGHRVNDGNGEGTFPMGGYWNLFRGNGAASIFEEFISGRAC